MDAVAVRERTRPPATTAEVNGRAAVELHPNADPAMTRAARAERVAWRLDHPEAWRRELEDLSHFDPEFVYDVAHDYGPDWTTDPDYGAECVDLWEYDENGVVSPVEKRAWKIQVRMTDSAADPLVGTSLEADYEREVRFRPETIAHVNRFTDARHHVRKGVRADLLVRSAMSARERERFAPEGILRVDRGAPVPRLVLEVLSKGSASRDLDYKRYLYEAAGVSEYLVYDLGGKRRVGSPRELLMFRLEGGTYRQVASEPKGSPTDPDAFRSIVFGTLIRMLPDEREHDEGILALPEEDRPPPRFQWWDAGRGRWRDRETDAELERAAERGRIVQERDQAAQERDQAAQERDRAAQERDRAVQERTDMAIAMMRSLLSREMDAADLDRVEAVWRRDAPPTDAVDRILKVQQVPHEWRSLLLPDENTDK